LYHTNKLKTTKNMEFTAKTLTINNFQDNYSDLVTRIRKNEIKFSQHGYDTLVLITMFKKYVINSSDKTLTVSHFDYMKSL